MNNRPFMLGMGKLALFGIGLSVGAVHASIDSGGGKGSVGPLTSHSSLGAPFATSSVTAGGIDLLYPLQSEKPIIPPEKPSGGSSGDSGSGGGPAPAPEKRKDGGAGSKKNSSSSKKSSANKAQNKKSTSATKKKSTSQSKKKSKKK